MTYWLPTLTTRTPQEGHALAVKMARDAGRMTRPDAEVHDKLRPVYAGNADALHASSQDVATHFTTVAAANVTWRAPDDDH